LNIINSAEYIHCN